jgi:hypothetical protein
MRYGKPYIKDNLCFPAHYKKAFIKKKEKNDKTAVAFLKCAAESHILRRIYAFLRIIKKLSLKKKRKKR